MGEKGNLDALSGAVEAGGASLVERTTTTIVSTATDTGAQAIDAIRAEAIGAVAEQTIAEARDRIHRDDDPPTPV